MSAYGFTPEEIESFDRGRLEYEAIRAMDYYHADAEKYRADTIRDNVTIMDDDELKYTILASLEELNEAAKLDFGDDVNPWWYH